MYINSHALDAVGAVFSLLSVFYSLKANHLTWPLSIIAVTIGIALYTSKGLYGDASLHIIYLAMSFYGWHKWKYGGKKHSELPITNLSPKSALVLIAVLIFGTGAVAALLHFATDSKVPLWDAAITVIGLTATWLTCKKIVQSWILWFIADILFAGIYFYKDIPAHAILYSVYVALAIAGYLRWKNLINTQVDKQFGGNTA